MCMLEKFALHPLPNNQGLSEVKKASNGLASIHPSEAKSGQHSSEI